MHIFYDVGLADSNLKGVFEVRVGYFGSLWETPKGQYGFPLDPKRRIQYITEFSPTLDRNADDHVTFCWVFKSRTDFDVNTQQFTNTNTSVIEIHICPYQSNNVEPVVCVGSWNIQSFDGIKKILLFEEVAINKTKYYFKPIVSYPLGKIKLDLFSFIKILVTTGRLSNAEMFSSLSYYFKVYNGVGNFILNSISFPSEPLPCENQTFLSSGNTCKDCPKNCDVCLN